MFKPLIRKLVTEELEKRLVKTDRALLPQGYNPLEVIRGALFHWVPVPFNGTQVWCELRCLNASQILSLGNYSNIEVKGGKKPTKEQIIELRNYQEQLIQGVMNKPSFDEVANLVGEQDFVIREKRKAIEELKKTDTTGWTEKQKADLQSDLINLELFVGYLLPEDAFGFLSSWANGNDISDIKKLADDQLLEAAILAENGNDNPHDHVPGVFTDHNQRDIDVRAWAVYNEHQKKKTIERKIRGR
jgi:hypothetical protein